MPRHLNDDVMNKLVGDWIETTISAGAKSSPRAGAE